MSETSSLDQLQVRASKAERDAHQLLAEHKNDQAFEAYRQAAFFYHQMGSYELAGHCYTKAGACWSKHIGHQLFRQAAAASEDAADEFLKAGNYELAIARLTDAALFYDKEGNAGKFSTCFYKAKQLSGRQIWKIFRSKSEPLKIRASAFIHGLLNFHSRFLWGYGEKPFRTLRAAALLILLSAAVFWCHPLRTPDGSVRRANFGEAFYLSVITFSTVGYGDYLPATKLTRAAAAFESLSGIVLTPLFLIALTRRYLRMT